jgi:hypothetical protein
LRALIGVVAIVAAIAALVPGAKALDNGNELLDRCTDEGYGASGFCMGYLSGVSQMLIWWQTSTETCFNAQPHGVTNRQAADVVVKFLRQYPEKRDNLAILLVAAAFADAWPCK